MKIYIRGEGVTDAGTISFEGDRVEEGPLIILIKKMDCYRNMVEECFGGSDEYIKWYIIDKSEIVEERKRQASLYRTKGDNDLKSKNFILQAKIFGERVIEMDDDAVGIFFVDSDRDDSRYEAIRKGFEYATNSVEGKIRLIPAVPVKTIESWLLCCQESYRNCEKFENYSTSSPKNNPKELLSKDHKEVAEECDPNRIELPSFNRFREDLRNLINSYCSKNIC